MNAGVGVNEHAFGGQALGTVTGDGITVIEVTMIGGIEFDLTVVVETGCDLTVRRNGFDDCKVAIGNTQGFVGAVNWMRSPTGEFHVRLR